MDITLIAVAAVTFTLAGFVKGVIGLGLPTVAMGVLGSAIPPAQAAALLLFPTIVTNVWQMATGPGLGPLLRRLWPMLLAAAVCTWLSSGLLTGGNPRIALAGLGAALIVNAAIGLRPRPFPRLPPQHEAWAGPLAGAATGIVTGATGVSVIPVAPYLGALGLPRDEMVQALGLAFTVTMFGLASALGQAGVYSGGLAGASALCLIPASIGMMLGNAARKRISPETFRRWFYFGLLALGAQLIARGFG
ncbi:sulfite exporter TauE/SafE family protein [Pararoseomonas indoligenes]|uniref:Probable membrane transporter protein n=1 Tax=Roseomonas indoligenes TaxID=2820811 RepID=A0A940S721_9PROT|nr:sulfite exporter TauE/SafE family protein [Pararoseomonas indoligenes]MBP0492598.1 sulfite exporter TauE/SafE family protein [Pararoseomonas indoligenes]